MTTTQGRAGVAAVTTSAVVVLAVAATVILSGVGGPVVVRDVDDLAQAVAAGLASVSAGRAARRHDGRPRRGWTVMAAGLALWAGGQVVWCWYEVGIGRAAPFPSAADAGFLGFSACATVAVCLLGDEDRGVTRVRAVVDGLVVAGSLLLISWVTALGATVRAAGAMDFALLVSLAYPVADIVLLTMTVQMLTRVPGARSSLVPLGAGAVALALADSSYTFLTVAGRYHTGDPLDLGWIGGFGLIAVAAARARPRAPGPGRSRRMVVLPYAVLAVAAAILGALVLAGRHLDPVEGVIATLVVLLVLGRQYLIVVDNQELVRTVEAREAQLTHQAFHDPLTDLPNRARFNDRVAHALDLHALHHRPLAVLFCDLDDFKVINDTLGHRAGDHLLVRVADRLRGAVRPADTLARLGGDEFAVLVESGDADDVARRVLDALSEPFLLGGRLTPIHASIGIGVVAAGEPTPTAPHLLADADTAMYAVKRSGKAGARVYHAGLRLAGVDDLDLHQALTAAVAGGRIRAEYQPIVDPVSGRVHAVECLARWERDGVAVSPGVFVPLAERLGLVQQLTDRMLESGVAQLAAWSSLLGHHRLRVNVNVSAAELGASGRLVERVAAVLARHPVRADQLVVEITESAVASDPELAGQVLATLRELGVHVALDDFGVGQSSLSRLRDFPIDYLKLDGALIRDVGDDETQALVVASIMELGHHLGMRVIAEGVETGGQARRLAGMARPVLLQGYGLGRPAPASELTQVLVAGIPPCTAGPCTAGPGSVVAAADRPATVPAGAAPG